MPQRKKPASEHKANSTYKPSRHATPVLPVEIPVMPADMGPKAQAAWNVLTRQLFEAGVIASLDMQALRVLCETIELYTDATDEMRRLGIMIQQTNKGGFTNWVQNPAVRIQRLAASQMMTLLNKFGMTPAARTGIPFDQQAENEDEAEVASILKLA